MFAVVFNNFTSPVEPWVRHWLTPLWILGVASLLSIVACVLVSVVLYFLSRLPFLGRMAENRGITLAFIAVAGTLLAVGANLYVYNHAAELGLVLNADFAVIAGSIALAAFFVAAAIPMLLWRRTTDEIVLSVREGVLKWFAGAILSLALFGIVGVVIPRNPDQMLESLLRWRLMGNLEFDTTVPTPGEDQRIEPPEHSFPVDFRKSEIRSMTFTSNETVKVTAKPTSLFEESDTIFEVNQEKPVVWKAGKLAINPFEEEDVKLLYVRNLGDAPANLKVSVVRTVATPEMLAVPAIVGIVLAAFLAYLTIRAAFPKLSAIAIATAKSEMSQPLYLIILYSGLFLLGASMWIPYNTFGEDIKMLKETGMQIALLLCVFQAIWAASSSVSEEIEGRTALTVLSKPVGRRDFVLGKFFGVALATSVMYFLFGLMLFVCVAYKPIYDQREGGSAPTDVTWQLCFQEMINTAPGLLMSFLETIVLMSISIAISTRLSLIPNLLIVGTIFALGHLTPVLVESSAANELLAPVVFMAQLVSVVIPVLGHFSPSEAIAQGKDIPPFLLLTVAAYAALYCSIAMLVALLLFEDRDTA